MLLDLVTIEHKGYFKDRNTCLPLDCRIPFGSILFIDFI